MGRIRKYIFLMCVCLGCCFTIAYGADSAVPHSVFSHDDIRIENNQAIVRLLVAGANATVSGTVKEGVILVDGNLHITPEAWIKGSVVVLGGDVERDMGSQVEGYLINIPPQGFPPLRVVIGLLLFMALLSLILLPYLVWLIFHMGPRFSVYQKATKWLQDIKQRWPAFYIALTLAFSCSMLVLFGELAWETMFRHAMGVFDNTLIWLVRYFASPAADRIMIFISKLGFGLLYAIIVATAFAVLAVYRRWLEMKGLALSFAGGAVLNYILKNLFERARPDAFHVVAAAGYSFPSGHAMVSLCFYGMLAFLLARTIHSWQGRYVLGVVTVLLIAAIGISRIYLGVHYPSDVVAGYTAGTMWLMFCISLVMLWEKNRLKSKE